jgi:hypothetical protein
MIAIGTSKNVVIALFNTWLQNILKPSLLVRETILRGLQKIFFSGDNPFKKVNGSLKVEQLVAAALFL